MMGSGDPTPHDFPALIVLGLVAVVAAVGCVLASEWHGAVARRLRVLSAALALAAIAIPYGLTPTENGIVGAARLLTLWPAFGLCGILLGAWTWRARRSATRR